MTQAPFALTTAEWRAILAENCRQIIHVCENVTALNEKDAKQGIDHLERMKTLVRGWHSRSKQDVEAATPKEKLNGHTEGENVPAKKKRGRPKRVQPEGITQ